MTSLTDYMAGWPRRFDWCHSHCGHFALGWVQASTGRPVLAAMPAVAGLRDWCRTVRAEGGLRRMVAARARCEPVPPELAQAGDMVLLPGVQTGGALGVRLHAGVAVLDDTGRVRVVGVGAALCAWPLAGILAGEVPA